MTTTTTIIIICIDNILIYAIPSLSPLDDDHNHPTLLPPLFRIPFPSELVPTTGLFFWKSMYNCIGWYSGPSQPLYFNILCRDSRLLDFEIVIEPDLSDASLHLINASQPSQNTLPQPYRICEDTFVSCGNMTYQNKGTVHIRSMSSSPTNDISPDGHVFLELGGTDSVLDLGPFGIGSNSLCPASGKFVYLGTMENDLVVVVDYL